MSGLATTRLAAQGAPRATIIALPGLIESVAAMLPTLRHWAGSGFDVLGIDPRGHGASPRWPEALLRRHPGDVIVEDVLETLAAMPPNPAIPLVLFGHSAGGAAAAAVAARLSGRVGAVVLEDPFWRLPVTQFQDAAVAARAAADLRRLQGLSLPERIAEIRDSFPNWPEDELPAWAQAKDDTDLALVANGHVIPSRGWSTLMEDLRRDGVPVLVLTGTLRTGITPNHRAILRSLGAEIAILPGATHFIRRDFRDRFHKIVEAFLARAFYPGAMSSSPGAG